MLCAKDARLLEGFPGALAGDRESHTTDFLLSPAVPVKPIGVVQMNEKDLARRLRHGLQALDRLGHERMGNVADRTAGNLVGREERPVQKRDVDRSNDLFDPAIPFFPLVDVGKPEEGSPRAPEEERYRIGVFIAVRYADRRGVEPLCQRELRAGLDLPDLDVLQRHEPAPGSVFSEKLRHRGGAIHGQPSGICYLAAQLSQAEVVPDVRVRQKNRVGNPAQSLDLLADINAICGTSIAANFQPPRTGDVRDSLADISLARQVLGFPASINLREGLDKTVAAMR